MGIAPPPSGCRSPRRVILSSKTAWPSRQRHYAPLKHNYLPVDIPQNPWTLRSAGALSFQLQKKEVTPLRNASEHNRQTTVPVQGLRHSQHIFVYHYDIVITWGISTFKSILISGPRQQPIPNDPITETDVGFSNLKTPVIFGRRGKGIFKFISFNHVWHVIWKITNINVTIEILILWPGKTVSSGGDTL